MTIYLQFKSDYQSSTLTADKRAEVERAINEHHRTAFYDLTAEQIDDRNEYTLENLEITVQQLTFDVAVEALGLQLVTETTVYQIDPDTGEELLDPDGKKVRDEGACIMPDHDVSFTVKHGGHRDCDGTPIPVVKGRKVAFLVTRQATNRPRNETNYTGLVKRMAEKWTLNGETCIKDCTGTGISEQHRCLARVILTLCDTPRIESKPADWGPPIIQISGIHPDAAITADTGKSNSGKDIFASDPELVPSSLLQTAPSLAGTTDGIVLFVPDRVKTRVQVCGKCESATKMVALRMAGKNVNSSLGNSNEATELAHRLVSSILPDMDDLAVYSHTFACPKIDVGTSYRPQPVSPGDVCAAIALYAMRSHNQVDIIPRDGIDGGTPIDETNAIRFDLPALLPFFTDLADCNGVKPNRLTEWVKARASATQRKESKTVKFAQLCRVIAAYFDAEEITPVLLNRVEIGGAQSAASYYHFGGADCGHLKRAKKGDA